jgi:hypothetical protein
MDATKLTSIVGVLLALSIASERLVEIIKGLWPWLDKPNANETAERRRCSAVQFLAVVSGVVTAFLASSYIPPEIARPADGWSILGLGLLASGGSGLWNSVLTYLTKVKDVKKAQARLALKRAQRA